MSDVTTFIEAIGHDVNSAVVPGRRARQADFRKDIGRYGPRVSTFAGQLVNDIIDEQSGNVREFVTT